MNSWKTCGAAFRFLLAAPVLLALMATSAYAHKLKIFAAADGKVITGYAYFTGGGRPKNATVKVTGPDGAALGEVATNEDGEFTFAPQVKCDHVFTVESGDGHSAAFTVGAEELPDDLGPAVAEGAEKTGESTGGEVSSLARQIIALREQLDRFEEKRRVQDVVGGIGYIVGVAGVAFYLSAIRKRNEKG